MFRKILLSSALAAVMVCPATFAAKLPAPQSQNRRQQAQAKTVAGTVTAIGSDRKSFTLNVDQQSSSKARKMDFYIDRNTQVQGRVGVGTKALVQYEPTGGRNLALNVTPQAGQ